MQSCFFVPKIFILRVSHFSSWKNINCQQFIKIFRIVFLPHFLGTLISTNIKHKQTTTTWGYERIRKKFLSGDYTDDEDDYFGWQTRLFNFVYFISLSVCILLFILSWFLSLFSLVCLCLCVSVCVCEVTIFIFCVCLSKWKIFVAINIALCHTPFNFLNSSKLKKIFTGQDIQFSW